MRSTLLGFVFLALVNIVLSQYLPSASSSSIWGDLADFPGTYVGSGYNLVAVPDNAATDGEGFDVKIANYTETTIVKGLTSTTPNHFPTNFQQVPTFMYETRAYNIIDSSLLHAENGEYLTFFDAANPTLYKNKMARLTSIPHGATILAFGNYSVTTGSNLTPDYPSIDAFPIAIPLNGSNLTFPAPPPTGGPGAGGPPGGGPPGGGPPGGGPPGGGPPGGGPPGGPGGPGGSNLPFEVNFSPYIQGYPAAGAILKILQSGINFTAADKMAETTSTITKIVQFTLDSSVKGGGIVAIPFLSVASPADYRGFFWLETVSVYHKRTRQTTTFTQFQYFQFCFLDFPDSFFPLVPIGSNIRWPHIQVSTLRKITH